MLGKQNCLAAISLMGADTGRPGQLTCGLTIATTPHSPHIFATIAVLHPLFAQQKNTDLPIPNFPLLGISIAFRLNCEVTGIESLKALKGAARVEAIQHLISRADNCNIHFQLLESLEA